MARQLFTNQTIDGQSGEFTTQGPAIAKATGTFDGAILTLQSLLDNSNDVWQNVAFTIHNTDRQKSITYNQVVRYRFDLSNAGASTDINLFITEV